MIDVKQHKLVIVSDGSAATTHVYIDGNVVNGLQSIVFRADADDDVYATPTVILKQVILHEPDAEPTIEQTILDLADGPTLDEHAKLFLTGKERKDGPSNL